MKKKKQKILVTGGAGYIGSVLVPKLLEKGHEVKVFDLYIYDEHIFDAYKSCINLEQIKGDIRNTDLLQSNLQDCSIVIHLACISNDPSCELDLKLTKSINYDAFVRFVDICKKENISRFIFASSGSVYGISDTPNITEDHKRVPVSLYNHYKALCEDIIVEQLFSEIPSVIIRPATICGYSPRQRLDLTVNILTNHAVNLGVITVFGGSQMRPNLHIEDMADLYVNLVELPEKSIAGKIYNASYQNYKVSDIANIVKTIVTEKVKDRKQIDIVTAHSEDSRSYHVSSEKIKQELGFVPKKTIEDAVLDLINAFQQGKIPNPLKNINYYNIKKMQSIQLT